MTSKASSLFFTKSEPQDCFVANRLLAMTSKTIILQTKAVSGGYGEKRLYDTVSIRLPYAGTTRIRF
jgi:hypothetical protein